jgi:hypothetical protein
MNRALGWLGDRAGDLALWPRNLVRYLPFRARRFAETAGQTVASSPEATLQRAADQAARSSAGIATRAGALLAHLSDLVGTPEAFRILWHLLTHNSQLSPSEVAYAASVLGPEAIRYRDVRVAEGGILRPIFRLNRGRAFTTFHTINLPGKNGVGRTLEGLVVHELVHVLQHERLGSVYIGQCLHAQRTEGYGYGGAAGLYEARDQGRRLCDFNREQQAQIAEDYYNCCRAGVDVTAYEPFIQDLREGSI